MLQNTVKNEKETYQTYTFYERVRIEETNRNMIFVKRLAGDLELSVIFFFQSQFFLLVSKILQNSNNQAFRLNEKVIDLSSFQKISSFSAYNK